MQVGGNVTARQRLFCGITDCQRVYLYHKALLTHLKAEHRLDEGVAKKKFAEAKMKANVEATMGANFKGSIHLIFFDLETTGLITDEQPKPKIVEIAAILPRLKYTIRNFCEHRSVDSS